MLKKKRTWYKKEFSGEQEEEDIGQEYRNKREASTTNGLNHYPNTTQYTGKARMQNSS